MKKILVFMLASMYCACAFSFNAAAGCDAFEQTWVTVDYPEVIDNPSTQKAASYVEGFGIGNTFEGDVVRFDDVDFSTEGANIAILGFACGKETQSLIELYVDSVDTSPVATFTLEYTGGWDSQSVKPFEQPVNIAAGKHTVYIKWINDTGSLHYIKFASQENALNKNLQNSSQDEFSLTPDKAQTESPQTSDMGVVYSLFAMAMSGAAAFVLRKTK